jgi:hypothetical protein
MAQQPLVGQSLLIIEDAPSHSDTPHSVGLLWTSDQPDADIYLTTHKIRKNSNPQSQKPTGYRPTPSGLALPRIVTPNLVKATITQLFGAERGVSLSDTLCNTDVANYTDLRESHLIPQLKFAPPCVKMFIFKMYPNYLLITKTY